MIHQISEWNEDWNEGGKKIHIKCTYDDIEVLNINLPKQLLRDGLQRALG
jgi:hypothetical protein